MKRLVAILLGLSALHAQEEKKPAPASKILAIKGAKVYTVSGAPIENAVVLIENGKISAVGADVKVPDGAEVLDAGGKVLVPGLVDPSSRLFLDSTDLWGGGSPEQDAYDLVNPFDPLYKEALQNGVTTVALLPMGRGPIGGLGVVLKPGADRAKWAVKRQAFLRLSLGSGGGDSSSSLQRYETYRSLKGLFDAAKQYKEMWEKYRKDLAEYQLKKKQWDEQQKKKSTGKPEEKKEGAPAELKEEPKKPQKPRKDARSEVLVRALEGQLLVRIEAHAPDSIEWAVALAGEFKLKVAIDCGTEAHRAAATLAKEKIPVVVGPLFLYGFRRVDYVNHTPECAGLLAKAGVPVAIGSFPDPAAGHSGGGATRFLGESAALAAAHGLPRDAALRAITLEPARLLGLETGAIEKGKAADLVLLTGEPFEPSTRVERTMSDGVWVYQRKIE